MADEQGLELKIIGSVKTGLANKKNSIVNELPQSFLDRTIGEAIQYLIKNADQDMKEVAGSVRKEYESSSRIIMANGATAEDANPVRDYIKQESTVVDGENVRYNRLDLEVSSVQQGGSYRRLF